MLYMSEQIFRSSEKMATDSRALDQTFTFSWKHFIGQFNPICHVASWFVGFFELDSVKENYESCAKAAHSNLNPYSWPSISVLQDKDFAEAGKLSRLCETAPSWIILDLGVGSMSLQVLALQRCCLTLSLCITL